MKNKTFDSSEKGYSLIEVLLATAIFSVVLVIGTASFATVNRVAREAKIYQDLSQTGTFVSETLARSVRNASGVRVSADSFSVVPFKITNFSQNKCQARSFPMSGMGLEIHGGKNRTFFARNNDLILKDLDSNEEGSLLSSDVVLEGDICFWGIDYTKINTITAQPYIIFEFTLKHVESNEQKTFRSAIVGREYF